MAEFVAGHLEEVCTWEIKGIIVDVEDSPSICSMDMSVDVYGRGYEL